MKRIAILVTFLGLAATGCKKDATAELQKFADRACECKDAACADKLLTEFGAWAKDNKDAGGNEEKGKEAAMKMLGCIQKAGGDPTKLLGALK